MIADPAVVCSADRNLNTDVVRSRYLEAVGWTRLEIHHMKKCAVVDAAIPMLPGLEYGVGRAKHLAATDEVPPAKLALNSSEINIQGLVHAMAPSTRWLSALRQQNCPNSLPCCSAHFNRCHAPPSPALSAQSDGPRGLITDKTNDTNNL